MASYRKVVWYEGMKLDPHHFQQLDRFYQSSFGFHSRLANAYNWGITDLQFDSEALANGQIGMVRCKGVMPDGLIFEMPANDPLPQLRAIEEYFPATAEHLDVYLAIRAEKSSGNNCQIERESIGSEFRFTLDNVKLMDDNSGIDPREVGVARANFQLRFAGESLEDFVSMKIAEVKRVSSNVFTVKEDYQPACLNLSASEKLMNVAREVLSALVTASGSLRAQMSDHKGPLNQRDLAVVAKLKTINSFLPVLNHYYRHGLVHPEQVFIVLLSLAGELTTFGGTEHRPSEFKEYNHNHPFSSFQWLSTAIQQMVATKAPEAKFARIDLEQKSESLFIGDMSEPQLATNLYITVSGEMPERQVIDGFPGQIKIASETEIFAVVNAGLQGLQTIYVAKPPRQLTEMDGKYLFKIEKVEPFWKSISDSLRIALYLSKEFSSLSLELISLKDEA